MVKRRDPNSHPPTTATRLIEVDTSKVVPRLNSRLKGGRENPVRVSSGGDGDMPAELPVRIDVFMALGRFEHDTMGPCDGLMGHVIDMDFYTKQSRVEIKCYRDPNALAIVVNGEEVYRWAEDEADLPVNFFSVISDTNDKAAKWIDQVDLQPGDEVIHDSSGRLVILRENGEVEPAPDDADIFGPNGDEAMDAYLPSGEDEAADFADAIFLDDDPILEEDDDPILEEDDDGEIDWD